MTVAVKYSARMSDQWASLQCFAGLRVLQVSTAHTARAYENRRLTPPCHAPPRIEGAANASRKARAIGSEWIMERSVHLPVVVSFQSKDVQSECDCYRKREDYPHAGRRLASTSQTIRGTGALSAHLHTALTSGSAVQSSARDMLVV